jgi:hypothetical protein
MSCSSASMTALALSAGTSMLTSASYSVGSEAHATPFLAKRDSNAVTDAQGSLKKSRQSEISHHIDFGSSGIASGGHWIWRAEVRHYAR